MSLYVTSVNSGSNGNCYYIGNDTEAVLIDVGISCREIEKRMKRLSLSMQKIKAIFISHEHSDHIRGLCSLINKFCFTVYITSPTLLNCGLAIENSLIRHFNPGEPVTVGGLSVIAFAKHHDASDPCSFMVTFGQLNVGVFTDIGHPCKQLIHHFRQCHAAFLEANYDEQMLEQGSYPYHLKKRIRGGKGHLSNAQALEVFTMHKPAFMTHLFLSHLSKNNNCPELVARLFAPQAGKVKVIVASRYEETALYEINETPVASAGLKQKSASQKQLAFSFT